MTVSGLFFGYGCSVPMEKIVAFIHANFKPEDYASIMKTHEYTDPKTLCERTKICEVDDIGSDDERDYESDYECKKKYKITKWKKSKDFSMYCIEEICDLMFKHKNISIHRYNDHNGDDYDTHMFVGNVKSMWFDCTYDKNPCIIPKPIKREVKTFLKEKIDCQDIEFKTWPNDCSCCS